ncbi:putative 31.7 kDa protein in traX-finO intergenic region [Cyphellophora attinorum]|uniref:Putative 31.7 kDa protein in traX-finO intergenic region n=1 Tax=Cyphellophora attinorum TaxID=1664694 RepID=A0A0N1GZL2_9EURO|nr:putative 31.7 kDa protein in traX-finO intergenic region [Phialophora attinorum]KPI36677.1 putative 31.7 kDa protein in traX-finO intergenic region [Phialophora attinorum]
MSRIDIEFQTSDHVTLRGWLFKSDNAPTKLPCLVMCHGFSGLKEMDLGAFAERFVSSLQLVCLVYDNRGFGASDTGPNQPRQEILPWQQMSDISDAITYAQSRDDIDAEKIGIWGSSYSGGEVLWVGATDKRVKVVLSQQPCVDGYENFQRLIRGDVAVGVQELLVADRLARARGELAGTMPVVSEDPTQPAALPTSDSSAFFDKWQKKNDTLTPTDLALEAYSRAREPKQLHILPGGHFDGYTGKNFDKNTSVQIEFLREHLCS